MESFPREPAGEITRLVGALRRADGDAAERLFPLVYDELRALAGSWLGAGRGAHTLQPTALVHEAWIKLAGPGASPVEDRAHFFALAARVMRQVLVDHARARGARKRDAGGERVTLAAAPGIETTLDSLDVLALNSALERLAQADELKARIVELRFFGGLSGDEVAEVLGTSASTVDREWRFARAWLARELAGGET